MSLRTSIGELIAMSTPNSFDDAPITGRNDEAFRIFNEELERLSAKYERSHRKESRSELTLIAECSEDGSIARGLGTRTTWEYLLPLSEKSKEMFRNNSRLNRYIGVNSRDFQQNLNSLCKPGSSPGVSSIAEFLLQYTPFSLEVRLDCVQLRLVVFADDDDTIVDSATVDLKECQDELQRELLERGFGKTSILCVFFRHFSGLSLLGGTFLSGCDAERVITETFWPNMPQIKDFAEWNNALAVLSAPNQDYLVALHPERYAWLVFELGEFIEIPFTFEELLQQYIDFQLKNRAFDSHTHRRILGY